jgi:RNA polymerase sigma-70 factor, ECF subfamily
MNVGFHMVRQTSRADAAKVEAAGFAAYRRRIPIRLHLAALPPDTGPVLGAGFADVLAAAQGRDERAFSDLFRDVQPVLLRYLQVLLPDGTEDVAAETWLQVVAGLDGFRGDERAFRAWLFTIARHRAVDWGRARARRRTVPLDEAEIAEQQQAADTADLALEHMSTEAVLSVIKTLPRDQAEIILLRVVVGLDGPDVARMVGKSPGAVRVAAHRGLRKLASLADRAGVTL